MKYKELYVIRQRWYVDQGYDFLYYKLYDYSNLNKIMYRRRGGRGTQASYNDVYIMADTETSKKPDRLDNHVCAFTVSIRAYDTNIVTLWGRNPVQLMECLQMIMDELPGDQTIVYFHNLSYDWQFIRKFTFKYFGLPINQLNTKSHYPVKIEYECGLILKDSLILAQRSLDKWAADLNVDHQKAVGKWDYNRLRNQHEIFTDAELEYIEHDTLAGVECLNATANTLNKSIGTLPYTATGIPREDVYKLARANRGRDLYQRLVMSYGDYVISTYCFHGGYTHGNRHILGVIMNAICYDFASSYPFCLLVEKFPMEHFFNVSDKTIEEILKNSDDYAYMFRLKMIRPHVKDDLLPMPALQYSKCEKIINPILDNGRVLAADYAEIWLTEQDLIVIAQQYVYDQAVCDNVRCAYKDYLPRWLTDYIYQLFVDKTKLKGGDPVLYSIAKAKLNSVYGLHVQKNAQQTIVEDYITGEYEPEFKDPEAAYIKYINRPRTVLPYQWGVWVTSYAFRNLFELGTCVADDGTWLYSDTDSCYADKWDLEKIAAYNQRCKDKLLANGYGPVLHNGREYWLGVAELDGEYQEFITQGAKRYAVRDMNGNVKITVAGVPKKTGAKCLNDDLNNFKPGLIFDGTTTGKLTHSYIYVDDIYTDPDGNITGDSVDLTPCDYLLDSCYTVDWSYLDYEELEIQVYG